MSDEKPPYSEEQLRETLELLQDTLRTIAEFEEKYDPPEKALLAAIWKGLGCPKEVIQEMLAIRINKP